MTISKNIQHKVSPENEGATLATIVRNLKPDLSWSRIKKLIAQGHIKISNDVLMVLRDIFTQFRNSFS